MQGKCIRSDRSFQLLWTLLISGLRWNVNKTNQENCTLSNATIVHGSAKSSRALTHGNLWCVFETAEDTSVSLCIVSMIEIWRFLLKWQCIGFSRSLECTTSPNPGFWKCFTIVCQLPLLTLSNGNQMENLNATLYLITFCSKYLHHKITNITAAKIWHSLYPLSKPICNISHHILGLCRNFSMLHKNDPVLISQDPLMVSDIRYPFLRDSSLCSLERVTSQTVGSRKDRCVQFPDVSSKSKLLWNISGINGNTILFSVHRWFCFTISLHLYVVFCISCRYRSVFVVGTNACGYLSGM